MVKTLTSSSSLSMQALSVVNVEMRERASVLF